MLCEYCQERESEGLVVSRDESVGYYEELRICSECYMQTGREVFGAAESLSGDVTF